MTEYLVERPGCTLHCWAAGPAGAPVVVLTHGAVLDHRMWAGQVDALRARYRVVTWDVRGHGQSRPLTRPFTLADAVDDLAAVAGQGATCLIGHSMGGNIVQALIRREPDRAVALVLADTLCNAGPLPQPEALALRAAPILAAAPEAALRRAMAAVTSVRADVRAYLAAAAAPLAKREIVDILAAAAGAVQPDPGYRIAKPLLLIHGERDGTGNMRRAVAAWAAREPASRYVRVPHAGHVANLDNPEAFNAALLSFLAGVA